MNGTTETLLGEALHDLAADHPFVPDVAAAERRGRRLRRRSWLVRGGTAGGVLAAGMAVALGVAGTAGGPPVPPTVASAGPGTGEVAALAELADAVLAAATRPEGDATLVLVEQHNRSGETYRRAEAYGDGGDFYSAPTRDGLAAAVAGRQDVANGVFGREVAIAVDAANGANLATARQRMADAALDPGTRAKVTAPPSSIVTVNHVWGNSVDALVAGGGRPEVRAGVLRILATLPTVKVARTTTDGRASLTLTAGGGTFGDRSVLPEPYRESLVIDASTGIPVALNGGGTDQSPDLRIGYTVSRVTLADLAAGKA